MIWRPLEKQIPCPRCGVKIDLDITKYPLDKPVVESCPWCNRKIRILKKRRLKPFEEKGYYFILTICKKDGSGRRKKGE